LLYLLGLDIGVVVICSLIFIVSNFFGLTIHLSLIFAAYGGGCGEFSFNNQIQIFNFFIYFLCISFSCIFLLLDCKNHSLILLLQLILHLPLLHFQLFDLLLHILFHQLFFLFQRFDGFLLFLRFFCFGLEV